MQRWRWSRHRLRCATWGTLLRAVSLLLLLPQAAHAQNATLPEYAGIEFTPPSACPVHLASGHRAPGRPSTSHSEAHLRLRRCACSPPTLTPAPAPVPAPLAPYSRRPGAVHVRDCAPRPAHRVHHLLPGAPSPPFQNASRSAVPSVVYMCPPLGTLNASVPASVLSPFFCCSPS